MDLNAKSALLITQSLLPILKDNANLKDFKKGVINVTSVGGVYNAANLGSYCFSKRVVHQYSTILAA